MRARKKSSLLALVTALSTSPALAAPPADLAAARQQMVDDLANLRFDKLGNPVLRWDHIPPVFAPRDRPHRLLVVLVEFPDRQFDRFAGDPAQHARLRDFYQDLLFDPAYERPNTLSHYYRTQSLDTYHLQGTVVAPVTLSKPRAAYGAPVRPEGGEWRNDVDSEGLVEEALTLVAKQNPDLDWAAFDRWDPLDHDGDDLLGESDGYLDHFVLVYAGGGQSSCDGLYKLREKLNPNTGPEALEKLGPKARECADRLWPHRFLVQKREGQGPVVEGRTHARGGVPLRPGLWALDYNMQSEYTEPSTFIHEFGHSIGLPDVYARQSSNSTGPWTAMSGTSDPVAQNLSAWERLMLGWLRPKVILPPEYGGRKVQSVYLRTLDDPLDSPAQARAHQRAGLWRSALVVLPPKTRRVELAKPPGKGRWALYSGQGNELNRTAELRLDLSAARGPLELSFAAWWDIEAGWDFAYLESSVDGGRTWQRRVPKDRRHMPAKHGHDGKDTLPGFTGLSGDLDGDGKNESSKGCDPRKKLAHGEDKAGQEKSPCQAPTWVRPAFDLSDLAGQRDARVRLRYFTDMAAVMRGVLIDDVVLKGADLTEDFESDRPGRAWRLDGFVRSEGHHDLLVPHYYLLEHRDPYASTAGHYRYDVGLTDASLRFFWDVKDQKMRAVRVRPRPGVLAWYYDGAYAWSENEPTDNGQGKGFLLALDANPNELPLPGLDGWLAGDAAAFDTRYEVGSEATQSALKDAFFRTMCFVRAPGYQPDDVDPVARKARCTDPAPPVSRIKVEGQTLMYGYQVINELLPGPDRAGVREAAELYDYKQRDGKVSWRLRDRSLRHLHTLDAPFALEPFEGGIELFEVEGDRLVPAGTRAHPAVSRFDDGQPTRWANPHLYFGGVAVPDAGFGFELATPKPTAPAPSRVKVWFTWDR